MTGTGGIPGGWAYQVGDEAFEVQGHRLIAEALARCG